MKKKLEYQADRIDAVLKANGAPGRIEGGAVTPRHVRFTVLPNRGTKVSAIRALADEVATALDVPGVKIERRGATVAIKVPRDDPQPVRLLPLYHQLVEGIEHEATNPIPPVTAILGLAEDGAPLLIRLPSPDVGHILVAGVEGAGKTMLLRAMILSLALENSEDALKFVLMSNTDDFALFENLPHLARPIIYEKREAGESLQGLARLVERQLNGKNGRLVIFIDDLAAFIAADPKGVGENLAKVVFRGREAGVHVVAATGNADVAAIAVGFPVRIVGRVASASDARIASGVAGTGAERLLGKGDFIAVAEGRVTRFQAAHVSPEEIRESVGRMAGGVPIGMGGVVDNGLR